MFIGNKKSVDVKRIGSTLVAAFRNSNPNLIWKFDLERNHSFTLAMQGEEGDLELGVTSPKGEFYPVARFTSQEDADEAFAAIQKILMKKKQTWFGCIVKWVAALVLLLFIIILVAGIVFGPGIANLVSVGASVSAQTPKIRNGVPLPADQVLKPPP